MNNELPKAKGKDVCVTQCLLDLADRCIELGELDTADILSSLVCFREANLDHLLVPYMRNQSITLAVMNGLISLDMKPLDGPPSGSQENI